MQYGFLIFTAIHVALAGLFVARPELDLWFAGFFFDPILGFVGADSAWESLPFLEGLTALFINGAVALLVINWLRWRNQPAKRRLLTVNRKIIFLLLTLALGPGLLINSLLKSELGRARPRDVAEFGGTRSFSPPYVMSQQCERNCSFVSGDAAVGYYLLAFLFIANRRNARIFAALGVSVGSAIGLLRVAAGAHFLSDIIFAGFLVVTIAWLLSFLVLRRHEESTARVPSAAANIPVKSVARK
jgi:lipid A 4'-phosphatase